MIGLAAGLAGIALLLSVLIVPLARRWALAAGFVDRPGRHKAHQKVIPLGGGIAINLAIAVPILAGLAVTWLARSSNSLAALLPEMIRGHLAGVAMRTPSVLALLGGAFLIHAVGMLDDGYNLRPRIKLILQFLVAAALVFGFDVTASAFLPAPVGGLLSILWIVAITNAFNLLDNADGLSAGVAVIVAGLLAACGWMTGQLFVPLLAIIVLGASLGFLVYNFPPARIFMGDAGSLVLGYWLGTISLLTTYYSYEPGGNPWVVLTPLVLFAVPLYDVASVMLIRWREGRPIWVGDRRHFSHRLLARGMTPRKVALTIYLATAAAGVGGLMIPALRPWQTWLVCWQAGLILLMIALLESDGRNGKKTS